VSSVTSILRDLLVAGLAGVGVARIIAEPTATVLSSVGAFAALRVISYSRRGRRAKERRRPAPRHERRRVYAAVHRELAQAVEGIGANGDCAGHRDAAVRRAGIVACERVRDLTGSECRLHRIEYREGSVISRDVWSGSLPTVLDGYLQRAWASNEARVLRRGEFAAFARDYGDLSAWASDGVQEAVIAPVRDAEGACVGAIVLLMMSEGLIEEPETDFIVQLAHELSVCSWLEPSCAPGGRGGTARSNDG
jgi:hypothetical protein